VGQHGSEATLPFRRGQCLHGSEPQGPTPKVDGLASATPPARPLGLHAFPDKRLYEASRPNTPAVPKPSPESLFETSMLELAHDPAFRLFACCALILIVLMHFLAFYSALTRNRAGIMINPEDAALQRQQGSKARTVASTATVPPDVERAARVHRNGLENVPLFLGLGMIGVLAGTPLLQLQICFIAFTVSRLIYTFAYLNAVQPWRSMSFGMGLLSNLSLGVLTMIHIF